MVHSEKLIAVVKCNGQILREKKDNVVYLPFQSEYSILFKNQNTQPALVTISIDGKSIGDQLIISPNSEVEIERPINDNKGYKFKFINKSKEIVEHRGDRIDDGTIRIEYQFEKQPDVHINTYHHDYFDRPYRTPPIYPGPICYGGRSSLSDFAQYSANINQSKSVDNNIITHDLDMAYLCENNINADEGITVEGSDSSQGFVPGFIGTLEEVSHCIVIRLKGYNETGKKISKPVTVRTKLKCNSCGKQSRSNVSFCSRCGTRLTI